MILTTTGRAVRSALSVVVAVFTTFAADAEDYVFPEKVPALIVHGATGSGCSDTKWITPNAAVVNLPTGALSLYAPAVVVDASCTPTYYALSPDRAIAKLAGTATSPPVLTAPITQPYLIGVKFHILSTAPLSTNDEKLVLDKINTSITNARIIFEQRHLGLQLFVNDVITPIVNATRVQAVLNLLPTVGVSTNASLLLQKLKLLAYSAGEINVYVLDGAPGYTIKAFAVQSYGPEEPFVVFNWPYANTESFAHELGHLLSLRHVNFKASDDKMYCYVYNLALSNTTCDYTSKNLMWVDGDADRDYVTPPQVLRAVFNTSSFVNDAERRNNPQPDLGDRFACPDSAVSPTCPFLGALQP